ncbi:MAG TPA: phenylalanine--tRNA ligase subunit beta [Kofleriaceae bacterium]|nr:phenylalanine--tRNA ligase subunit beta [Kofleriaceae bacterium]
MKVLWSWLLELCDLPHLPTAEEGARAFTGGGLEVEALTDLGAGFTGVVVAEVVGKRPHPNADSLTLVDVVAERGGAATQVVCGAPNVPAPGRKVLWARPGATLPGGIKLAVKAVKGIESPGMLCAADELGTGDDHSGIIVLEEDDRTALGAAAQRALGLDDFVLDIGVPANRGDCLGHLGLARELSALLGGRLVPPATEADLAELAAPLEAGALAAVAIEDPEGCPRYVARVIDGLTVGPSPRRIAQRLRAVGVRPISNLVDVTNYVLFELGQPLHAFDWHRLAGGRDRATIGVRRAREGERMTTLDAIERALLPADLLITSGPASIGGDDRAVALAGVMGGLDTEVTGETTRVLLESASFHPPSIRRTARRLALPSEASQRFERGVDPALAPLAADRAAALLARLGGGRVATGAVDVYPRPRKAVAVPLRLARARQLTGTPLSAGDCEAALLRLGCDVEPAGEGRWSVTPPSARADLAREVDLIEDVLRVHGYGEVPSTLPALKAAPEPLASPRADRARRALAAAGLAEALTFGFQSRERHGWLGLPADDRRAHPLAIRNPMSADQAVLRTSLLPNLLAAVARNRAFGLPDVALFEVGSVFVRGDGQPLDGEPTALPDEPLYAAVVLAGARPRWLGAGAPWDVFDLRGILDHLARALAVEAPRLAAVADVPYLHPGVAARVWLGDAAVGVLGEVHPAVRDRAGLDGPVFAFEVALDAWPAPSLARMRPVPRFPASPRDVSLLLGDEVPAARVAEVIRAAAGPLLETFSLAEEYRDARLGAGKKSVLWSISYRSLDRTLTDAEVDAAHEALVATLVRELDAQRR